MFTSVIKWERNGCWLCTQRSRDPACFGGSRSYWSVSTRPTESNLIRNAILFLAEWGSQAHRERKKKREAVQSFKEMHFKKVTRKQEGCQFKFWVQGLYVCNPLCVSLHPSTALDRMDRWRVSLQHRKSRWYDSSRFVSSRCHYQGEVSSKKLHFHREMKRFSRSVYEENTPFPNTIWPYQFTLWKHKLSQGWRIRMEILHFSETPTQRVRVEMQRESSRWDKEEQCMEQKNK